MLLADNIDLVKRDKDIPGLGTILDPELFVDALKPFFHDSYLWNADITYIRYKPGMNCLVKYSLETSLGTFEVYAKAHGFDWSIKLQKARKRKSVLVAGMPGRIILAEVGVIVSIFPNDSNLKKLTSLADPNVKNQLLMRLFPNKSELWKGSVQTLAYKPERRYVGQLKTKSENSVVLKFYTEENYKPAYTNNKVLISCKSLCLSEIISHSKHYNVLAFKWLPGETLQNYLVSSFVKYETIKSAGAELAKLHLEDTKGLSIYDRNAEAAKLIALAEGLSILCPHLSKAAKHLAKQLVTWLISQPKIYRPIHGDFYAKQVMILKDKATIIDFDNAVLSDPRADISLFLAHVEQNILSGLIPANRLINITNAFIEGYQCITKENISKKLQVYKAISLFQLTHHSFRAGEQDWGAKTKTILERIAEIIGSSFMPKSLIHI